MIEAADLHPARIADRCAAGRFGHTAVLFETVDSTNAAASAVAAAGAPEGTVVLAVDQTAGRGRHGRTWCSTRTGSLVFSLVARPRREPQSLTALLALAAAELFEALASHVAIKWPNDIWIGRRKNAGILAESAGSAVVLGMGIDVNETAADFAPEVRESAVSLRMCTGVRLDRAELLGDLLTGFGSLYDRWEREGFAPLRFEAERRLLWRGEAVAVDRGGRTEEGIIVGLTAGLSMPEAQQLGTLVAGLSVTSAHTINNEIDRESLRAFSHNCGVQLAPSVRALLEA